MLKSDHHLSEYQLLERICTTTGSHLCHALCTHDNLRVVLKFPDEENTQAARFRREYELLQALDLPQVVKPVALMEEKGRIAMLVGDVAGESLEAVLNDRRLDLQTCLYLAEQLADMLAGLHAAHLIHCDIRPANFMLVPELARIYLFDLSLAISETQQAVEASRLSMADWTYISPEQTGRLGRALDERTDFYSMGIMLYRMLSGHLPFTAYDPLEWAHCHIALDPPPLNSIASDVPQAVSDIVMKLLAKLPEDRYQSANGLRYDLDRCLAQLQTTGQIRSFQLGVEDFSDRFQIPHKLYGREHELASLQAAFDRMTATGERTLVTVSGYAGVGKSSLVEALRWPIVEKHGYFIAGKFDQYLRDIPYATLTQAFRELVQQLVAESETRIAEWRHQIQKAVGPNGQLIVDILPQVELIIGKQAPVPALPPVEAQNRLHRVFRQFVNVFGRREHPLTIFLDDLQWIDAASLQFIENLLSDSDTAYVLLIVAYRDNEVSTAHPLWASLEAIRRSDAAVTDIRLAPLLVEPLNLLLADTLHAKPVSCEPLARLVFAKTGGNPFFFTQFLASLRHEGWLRYDTNARSWQWDLHRIEVSNFADNVADLMVGKLRRLPVSVLDILQIAACLGAEFDVCHLALISRISQTEVERSLAAALHEGLILRIGGSWKFLHDRIQQAAYSLIPQEQRAAVHLRIGRTLLASLSAGDLDAHLFDVSNQFNRGTALLIDPQEKKQIAELYLRAGRRAKMSAAYASACVYLAAGMSLLDEDDWTHWYQLTFALWFERATCEFLISNLDETERLIAVLLQHGVSKIDQADIYSLKLQFHCFKSENEQAVESALACLRLFGIDLAAHPTDEQVRTEYEMVWQNLAGRSIESLIDLPLMTDPEMRASVRVFSELLAAALYTDLKLVHLLACRMVNVSMTDGICDAATFGIAWFSLNLGANFHRYKDGARFCKLAVDLVDRHQFLAYRARVGMTMGATAIWTQPIANAIDFYRASFRGGVETGDLNWTCYCHELIATDLLLRGNSLDEVWRETEKGLDYVRNTGFADVIAIMVHQQQFVLNMRGQTRSFSSFDSAQFNEASFEAQLTGRMTTMICWYWIIKTQARFLSKDYEVALTASRKAEPLLWACSGSIHLLDHCYFTALALAAAYETAPPEEQPAWREQLMAHQEQLHEWAQNYPPTFSDKHLLVSAEIARIDKCDTDAMRLYQQAIASARDNGFVKNEGIAYECASAFYRSRGFDLIADTYIREARDCFARWGAGGKVAQLEALHPGLRARTADASMLDMSEGAAQLDVLSVVKASQAISSRLVWEDLVDALLRLMLENVGAQSGSLLLMRDNALMLVADASVEQQTARVRHCTPASPDVQLPMSILNYVRRTREHVLLVDVAQPNPFSTDAYFARRHPKSVLCLPIVRQEALVGVLYFENNLITHAFVPARLTVLKILAAQAAISLENALLYADLREREARIRRLVESDIIGIFFWDLDGGILEANDTFLRMFGYSRQEVLSGAVCWTSMTPPEYRDTDATFANELKRAGHVTHYQKEYISKDGRRIPVVIGAAFLEGSQHQGIAFVLDQTQQKQAEAQIRYMAHHDALTSLPNRAMLQDRIQHAIAYAERNRTQVAIFFIDLDHFKHVNDSLGHSAGDRLLRMVAARLQQCLREEDTVGRLGGDEFILCISLQGPHNAALVVQKVINALHLSFQVEGHELYVNSSIGISLYPDDGADVESLMRAADTAMYHAKESGRNTYRFFTPALDKAVQQRLDLTKRLCQALACQEFVLYFQPQVNIKSGTIFAAEALLRWRQPGGVPMSCVEIIALAEETGLIVPIGEWVLRQACHQLKQWHEAGYPQLRIAVNLSPRQFYQPDLPGLIQSLLQENNLPPSTLELEITEGLLLQNNEDNLAIMRQLCEMGIALSMDDFGTGYSSLAYLQRFPIQKLKIDQSFVRGIGRDANDTALVAAIIAMAHSLHLNVLSEGVETEQQAAFLVSHGCLAAQGFYYGKAMPAEDFMGMLSKQNHRFCSKG